MAFFFKHLSLSGKIEGLYREEELEIPYKALRECCTNALCHRLYHRPGSSVGIAIYDDRVEIENSGTFPPDMTMGIVSGLFSAIPAKLLGTTRQLPHSYPTDGESAVRNRGKDAFDQRDYGYNRIEG